MKFAVLLANVPLADALVTQSGLRTVIGQAPVLLAPTGKSQPPVTISAGISARHCLDSWGALVARSDMALDQAIIAGGNRRGPGCRYLTPIKRRRLRANR